MIKAYTIFSIGVSILFSTTIKAQIILPFPPKLPKFPDFGFDHHKDDTNGEKTTLDIPKIQIKPNLDNVMAKLMNNTGKIKLEDIPGNTDLDELLKEIIYKGLVEYEEHNVKLPLLEWAVEQLKIPVKLFSNTPVTTTVANINICNVCTGVARFFIEKIRSGDSRDKIVGVLMFAFKLFHVYTERVARGLIELNIDILMYIVQEKKTLNEIKLCSIIGQQYSCYKEARTKWDVHIPNRDSPLNTVEKTSDKTFRILHLTDLHLDPLYKPGGSAVCGEPLCCQNDQVFPSSSKFAAGKWGDYRECDMPYSSFVNLLEQISQQIKEPGKEIDYIYYTGDIISHRIWNTSRETNTEDLQNTYKILKEYFSSIPVYSIIGNHEPHPLNVFSPPSITNQYSNRWIFDLMAEEWSTWLPNSTDETIRHGGYYSVVVKPGFRIVALNSNVCYILNWWLLYDEIDPFYQLRWLALTLKSAETNNEYVHILSHVPPGDKTCVQEWTRQFRRIVERFSHIIKGQFNGHTHYDELRIFYNSSNANQIINVAYNGGSFTTFSNLNPNYRYYTVNSDTYDVIDYEQWMYDLDEANSEPDKPPKWHKQYSFKDAYGLKSLKYEEFEQFIGRMSKNHTLSDLYYRHKVRAAAPSLLTGCKDSCKKDNLCDIVTTEVDDDAKCKELTRQRSIFPFL